MHLSHAHAHAPALRSASDLYTTFVPRRRRTWRHVLLVTGFFATTCLGGSSHAATVTSTWLGGTGGWSDAALWDTNPVVPDNNAVDQYITHLNSGSATIDGNYTVDQLHLAGADITNDLTLDVLGTMAWSAGQLRGTGTTTVSGLSWLGTTNRHLYGALVTTGTSVMRGHGTMYLRNGASLRNDVGATLSLDSDIASGGTGGDLAISGWSGSTQFVDNRGTLRQDGTQTTTISTTFDNMGQVEVDAGTLALTGGGASVGGQFVATTPGTLAFNGGTHTLDAASSISGTGTLLIDGGRVEHAGSLVYDGLVQTAGGTLALDHASNSIDDLVLDSGYLEVNGALSVLGTTTWNGGHLSGTGTTTVGALELLGTTDHHVYGTLANNGTTTLRGSGTLYLRTGAQVRNELGASFVANSDVAQGGTGGDLDITRWSGSGQSFDNRGTFLQDGTHRTTIGIAFDNTGTVDINAGELELTLGGTSNGGHFDVGAGTTLIFNGGTHDLDAATSLSGSGSILYSGGTVNHTGSLQHTGDVTVDGGTLALQHASNTLGNLAVDSGNLRVDGALAVQGSAIWSAGNLNGTGTTTFDDLTIVGSTNHHLYGDLVNQGTTALRSDGIFYLRDEVQIRNEVGAHFEANSNVGAGGTGGDLRIARWAGSNHRFENHGTFAQAGNQRTTTAINFDNTGLVDIQAGILDIAGATYRQTAGETRLSGGALVSNRLIEIDGGTLSGSGTVTGDVRIDGALSPGQSPGLLSIDGDLTLGSTSSFDIELEGLLLGTEYDSVDVTGTLLVGGVLSVSFLSGFDNVVTAADAFTIAQAGTSLVGLFANVTSGDRITTLEGHSFRVDYGSGSPFSANSVVLSDFAAVPEPGSGGLLALGLCGIAVFRRGRGAP